MTARSLPALAWSEHRETVDGIYVHVPFCASDCAYCAFAREVPTDPEAVMDYLDGLAREVEGWRQRFGGRLTPRTLYVGGGTPSFLTGERWARFSDIVVSAIEPSRLTEVTVEANPESVSSEWLDGAVRFGMTRLSVGAQSNDPRILSFLDRRHDWAAVERAIERVRDWPSVATSVDLIYGVPGLSLETWSATVEGALALAPDHLSAYCLSYEEGTSLSRRRGAGEFSDQSDERQRAAYERLVERAEAAGLTRYEVSNFGTDRGRSQHNLACWRGSSYLGLGPSAHSHVGGHRFWNHRARSRWTAALEKGEGPVAAGEKLGPRERVAECLMRLRLTEGIPLELLPRPGGAFWDRVTGLENEGILESTTSRLRVKASAFFVSDGVMAELLWAWDRERDVTQAERGEPA